MDNNHILFPNIYAKGDYIVELTDPDNGVEKEIARIINLNEVLENIDTGEISYNISFNYRGNSVELSIPRKEMNKRDIVKYQAYGADIFEHNATQIIKYLNNIEQDVVSKKVHTHVGWGEYKNKLIFKHFNAVGVESQYSGTLAIKPKGTLDGWLNTVKKHVMGNIKSESALLFGLSSVLVGLIKQEKDIDSLVFHLYATSSKGKTTMGRLAVSAFGCPSFDADGSLMTTWNATDNSIMTKLRDNFGLPILIDESSMSNNSDFTSMIYRLAGSKDKERLNKDSTMKKSGKWHTTIITTGEHSILEKSNHNTGLRVRVAEFANITWTKDAESADALKDGILENYGYAGIEIAKKIIELGKENVIKKWDGWMEKCQASMVRKDEFSHRISKKLAVIMTTAELSNLALNLDFNLEKILDFLIDNEMLSIEDRDRSQKAYGYFIECYNVNVNKFCSKEKKIPSGDIWGMINTTQDGTTEISIIPTIFEKIMRNGGFEDPRGILKDWKSNQLLSFEKDRLTRSRIINTNSPINVYVILVKQKLDRK